MTQRLKKKRMLPFGIYTDLYNFLRRLKGRIEDVPDYVITKAIDVDCG